MLRCKILAVTSLTALAPTLGTAIKQESVPRSELRPERETQKCGSICHAIQAVASEHDVDPDFVESVVSAESGFQEKAVSRKGALGLMQVMPHTAQELGYDPTDWRENLAAGTAYLAMLMRRYENRHGSLRLVLAAYNAGPGNVDRYGGIPPFPETRRYVRRVLSRYRTLKDLGGHEGRHGAPPDLAD